MVLASEGVRQEHGGACRPAGNCRAGLPFPWPALVLAMLRAGGLAALLALAAGWASAGHSRAALGHPGLFIGGWRFRWLNDAAGTPRLFLYHPTMPPPGTPGQSPALHLFGALRRPAPSGPGGLTLLAAAPGIGKTSWLLRMLFRAATSGVPAALGCYEHTPEELKFRLTMQAEALVGGAHGGADFAQVEGKLAGASETVLLSLSDQHDTVRALEDTLLLDYGFPRKGPALVAVDYLSRIPVVGLTGMLPEAQKGGEAAAALRDLSRQHGWAIIAAAALRSETFDEGEELSALLGDERVPYVADPRPAGKESRESARLRLCNPVRSYLERPHGADAHLADAILGRAFLPGAGRRIPPAWLMRSRSCKPSCAKPGLR